MVPLTQPHFWNLQGISLSSCSGETEDWGCVLKHTERPARSLGHHDLRRTETLLRDRAGGGLGQAVPAAVLTHEGNPQQVPRRRNPSSASHRGPQAKTKESCSSMPAAFLLLGFILPASPTFPAWATSRLMRPRCSACKPRLNPGAPLGASPIQEWASSFHSQSPNCPRHSDHSPEPTIAPWGLPPCSGACSPFTRESCTELAEKSREMGPGWLLVTWPRSVTRMLLWNSVTPGAWGDTRERGHS